MLEFSVKPCMEAFIHSFIHSRIHHHGHRRIATVATRTEFNGALWAGLTGPQQMGVYNAPWCGTLWPITIDRANSSFIVVNVNVSGWSLSQKLWHDTQCVNIDDDLPAVTSFCYIYSVLRYKFTVEWGKRDDFVKDRACFALPVSKSSTRETASISVLPKYVLVLVPVISVVKPCCQPFTMGYWELLSIHSGRGLCPHVSLNFYFSAALSASVLVCFLLP